MKTNGLLPSNKLIPTGEGRGERQVGDVRKQFRAPKTPPNSSSPLPWTVICLHPSLLLSSAFPHLGCLPPSLSLTSVAISQARTLGRCSLPVKQTHSIFLPVLSPLERSPAPAPFISEGRSHTTPHSQIICNTQKMRNLLVYFSLLH